MEDRGRVEAYRVAQRCLAAGAGQNEETRQALQRAAGKYALRALGLVGEAANAEGGPTPTTSPGLGRDHRPDTGSGETDPRGFERQQTPGGITLAGGHTRFPDRA